MSTSKIPSSRKREIVDQYLLELEKHLSDLKNGLAEKTFEIKDLAKLLFVHLIETGELIMLILPRRLKKRWPILNMC